MIDLKIDVNKDCTGCYACVSICPINCITMELDNEGFWYPYVDHKNCMECKKCLEVCPLINNYLVKKEPTAYAVVINDDDETLMKSSSGGAFTLIAEYILNKEGVVFGASFDDQYNVKHSYTEALDGIDKFRGSKYVQSKIGNSYSEIKLFLDSGRYVLFTGTPCQVAGLKSFLGKGYSNLLCVDFICHGVPSPAAFKSYIDYRKKIADSEIKKISFRSKYYSWKRFAMEIIFSNNIIYHESLEKDIYLQSFLRNFCLRRSCYDCNFKSIYRESDITLGDFWGIENILPDIDINKGVSLVLVNSKKAEELIKFIKNKALVEKVNLQLAIEKNIAITRSAKLNPKRILFLKAIGSLPFDRVYDKYCRDSFLINFKKYIKSTLIKILRNTSLLDFIKSVMGKSQNK
jgi:coenzyme F420-reducing hydrogenase beta subunit